MKNRVPDAGSAAVPAAVLTAVSNAPVPAVAERDSK
jgi:hypothetical protein